MTEQDLRAVLRNADAEERVRAGLPLDFLILDWDHLDFLAWSDPANRGRAYLVVERGGRADGILLRSATSRSGAHAAMCNLCHTMQPGDQVALFTARRGDGSDTSVGTYLCTDLGCHDTVRLAAPLAPSEIRVGVDRRIDGARIRAEAFVSSVLGDAGEVE